MVSRVSVLILILTLLQGCSGGGGGSAPPSPSLSSNLPSSVYDDETVVVTLTARNFGAGEKTYNASSNTLTVTQGNSNNQFIITGKASAPGNHTISFSASDTSGNSATLNSSIRVDAVPTGLWLTTSLSIGGVVADDVSAAALVTREGRVYLESYTYDLLDEKCFGSSSINAKTLAVEVWCASAPDGYQVTDENYSLTGELEIDGALAFGTYSVYESSGGLLGTIDVEMERFDPYEIVGLPAPTDAEGVYVGVDEGNLFELIDIDSLGNITPVNQGGICDIDGTVGTVDIELNEGNDYVSRGIFDAVPISQRGCVGSGNFWTGNRDILSGEGTLNFFPGAIYGFPSDDEVLFIALSDSSNSYGGIPSFLAYFRICSASGDPTSFGNSYGFAGQCSEQ